MIIKLGENLDSIQIESSESCMPLLTEEIVDEFNKTASGLKKISPAADDFLFFSAIMMHAAEASALNDDGSQKLTKKGEPVKVGWRVDANGSWKWETNDDNVKPYRNQNRDIFPEIELIKAHKQWVGKPLCIDHKSSSVDHVRGFIVDTYYDRKLKRVVALCALDKKNYPDLAHKVSARVTPSVSMGCGVGKAICTDCGRIAKVEADFCDHMKNKTCYGEINGELNPIELSIVVNPADPKAQIKHIIAAAENLNNYVQAKEEQLKKIAKPVFHANLGFYDQKEGNVASTGSNSASFNISTDDLPSFLKDLNSTIKQLKKMLGKSEEEKSDKNKADDSDSDTVTTMAPPAEKLASVEENILESLAGRLDSLKQGLDRLLKEETNMSDKKAYFQGTEEPTPGEVKYDKDPMNEDLREKDRQMIVDDMGPVDGMHPGPKSVGMSELERKKMLARAAAEERALKRAAIVDLAKEALNKQGQADGQDFLKLKSDAVFELNKTAPKLAELINSQQSRPMCAEALQKPTVKSVVDMLSPKFPALKALVDHCCNSKVAYFQGAGGVNEPTPGKTKYPADKMNVDLRDEDKQMTGAKPFPEVGDVNKLYGDDLKTKEKLSRASLNAKFVRSTTQDGAVNLDRSGWEVYSDNKLVLKASVNDLSSGRGELFFDSIATEDFGKKLMNQVKTSGASKVAEMYKLGQAAAPAAPAPMPAAPESGMPDLPPDLAGGGEAAAPMVDPNQAADMSDPKQKAIELSEQVKNVASDLGEAVKELTNEKAEMGAPAAEGGNEPPKTASFQTKALHAVRKEINSELTEALKECVAELEDHVEELDMVSSLCDKKVVTASNKRFTTEVFTACFDEAKESLANANMLLEAFVKYAKGTEALVKRAQSEVSSELESDLGDDLDLDSGEGLDLSGVDFDSDSDVDLETSEKLEDLVEGFDFEDESSKSDELSNSVSEDLDLDSDKEEVLDENAADLAVNQSALNTLDKSKVKPGDTVRVTASLETKEGRAQLRAKLAKETMKMKVSPLLDEAHPKGGTTVKFETSVSDDLDHVEDLEETADAMKKIVNTPVKVRKEAEMIHKLVSEGALSKEDVDELVSQGADKDAVAYYKKYYGEVEGGSEFASELVKEHAAKKAKAEVEVEKLKLARAFKLANEMAAKGLCESNQKSIEAQVDSIMKFNDDSFESLKNIVAATQVKKASKMPAVGYGEENYPTKEEDLVKQLSRVLSSTKRTMF